MKAQHTPGPWHWPHDSNDLCPVNPDPERSAVASILTMDGGYGFLGSSLKDTLAELEADRRLIAASPDMLSALQDAEAGLLFAGVTDDGGTEGFVPSPVLALRSVRAAIAKATGSAA